MAFLRFTFLDEGGAVTGVSKHPRNHSEIDVC